jgi:hypothetical protein
MATTSVDLDRGWLLAVVPRRSGDVVREPVTAPPIWARMVSFRFLGADSLGSATQRAQIVA